jgi:DNA-binding NarL/FixJ family response regulator
MFVSTASSPLFRIHSRRESPVRALQITPSERQALQLLANGHTPHDVAADLGMDAIEIERILTRLFAAMGAATQAEAIASARRRGLLTQEPGARVATNASSEAPA